MSDQNNDQLNTDNLQLASLTSRVIALVIDDLSITLIVAFMLWDKIQLAQGDLEAITLVMNNAFFQILFLKFVYQTFFIWYYGATIGKIVTKTRVIDFDHFGKVSLTNALLRSAGRLVSEAALFIGFIFAFFTDSRQTFHDKIGKTLVVNA